jgi:predicted nucleotidyltransferase
MRTLASSTLDVCFDLEALQTVLREHPIRLAILFGSQATETTHERSDIDIAVEFDHHQPADPNYNDVFLGLSADISDALESDEVDLVDLQTVQPQLAAAIFANGVLIVGEETHADELRHQLTATESDLQSPRERFDAALDRIDDHLDDTTTEVPATGMPEDDG